MDKIPSFLFRKIYSKGRIKRTQNIILRSLENRKRTVRFGLVISAKNIPLAVDRNQLKRRAREIINKRQLASGLDYVFILKKKLRFKELKDEIEDLL